VTYPWEQLPATTEPAQPLAVADVVGLIQADLRFMTAYTAVQVHSTRPALEIVVNTPRGQIVPRGQSSFTDGTTIEFQDIGMPQPGAPVMTVKDLMAMVWEVATELGLELSL